MAPLNVLSEIATPVSMSFRHFGNMAGGLVITTLIMGALKVPVERGSGHPARSAASDRPSWRSVAVF